MKAANFYSREIAAGYDPEIMGKAKVLIVGTGALGQAIAMNFSLIQVGVLLLVDNDCWEDHNATRSPCFPTPSETARWGNQKVVAAAQKLVQMTSWSKQPRIYYASKPIQALGDAPFRQASLVISAVDNRAARNHLGLMTAKHHKPLVEGGFRAERANYTVLTNSHGQGKPQPCWFCSVYKSADRQKALQLGCTRSARVAEAAGLIPAIQPTAAFLAAPMVDSAVQLLHGRHEASGNRRVILNLRQPAESMSALLSLNPHCVQHPIQSSVKERIGVTSSMSCRELLQALEQSCKAPCLVLPYSFVVRTACAECKRPISVRRPEWIWSQRLLYCTTCGGDYQQTAEAGNELYSTLSKRSDALLDLSLHEVGLVPGSRLQVRSGDAETWIELVGDHDLPFFTEVVRGT